MIQQGIGLPVGRWERRLVFRAVWLAFSCVCLWLAAQYGGDRYARAVYERQIARCARNMEQLADAIRRYRQDHPDVPVTEIGPDKLYPRYVSEREILYCPAVRPPRPAQRAGVLYSSYLWVSLGPDWPYIHRRRRDAIPLLICATHARARVSDRTANVVRMRGPVERIKIPLGVQAAEW